MPNKTVKTAEKAMTDAGKFPVESCREKIARRYGLDAVALSGPCEGEPLADCICDQLDSRWDRINDRFAGNESKVVKLALALADSWSKDEDDTEECAKSLEGVGYAKTAANGIAGYLKAYHIKEAGEKELAALMDLISDEKDEDEDDELDNLAMDEDEDEDDGDLDTVEDEDDEGPEGLDLDNGDGEEDEGLDLGDEEEDKGEGLDLGGEEDEGLDLGEGMEPGELEPGNGDTVTLELPVTVVEELVNAIEGYEHDISDVDEDEAMEVIELDEGMGEDVVPGEPAGAMEEFPGDQFVEGGEGGGCPACGRGEEEEMAMEGGMGGAPSGGGGGTNPSGGGGGAGPLGLGMASSEEQIKEAAMGLKGGRILKVSQKTLKIGPEMSINNTDQQAGGHNLGDAKEKNVEDPKALDESNIKTDPEKDGRGGHMAGGSKLQDGSTMGHEQSFDPHEVSEDEVTGGQSSVLGPDESYPEGGPEVPAGSSPIENEQLDGGNVSTKGTVIATITPKGIRLDVEGREKPVLAKVEIKQATKELVDGLQALKFDGDVEKFAREAIKVAKTTMKDGITYVDTSKLEGDKFTNDEDKKPQEGGAHTYYGKKGSDNSDDEHPSTNTSKLEGTKFTNDAEKKPYTDDEAKKASNEKGLKKEAADSDVGDDKERVVRHHEGDKDVEDPKALDDGNVHVDPEIRGRGGHMAGGTEVSAGDGSTQGSEKKFEAHEVGKDEVSGGNSSLQGPDESIPTEGAEVPAGGGQIGKEELDGGDVSTKGTVIAEADDQSQKRQSDDDVTKMKADQKVREARLKAASALVADMLHHGDIDKDEYAETLERYASMSVPAIQALAVSIKKARERAEVQAAKNADQQKVATAGLGIPVVYDSQREEKPLNVKISELFSINKVFDPNSYDENGRKKVL